MTKQELISRQKNLKRSSVVGSLAFILVFFAVLFGNRFVAAFMDAAKPPLTIQILYGIVFFGFLIGSVWFVSWSTKRRQRRFGMVCPSCGETISGALAHIAVASDRCGYCGTRLFSE
jgi:Flp pilus assembly protein TadB